MRSWGLPLVFVLVPSLVGAESLGEVARKERERRQKLQNAGTPGRTLTEQDAASSKGTPANDPSAPPATVEEGGPTGRSGGVGAGERTPAASGPGAEAFWRGKVAQARSRIAQAQAEYDKYQRWIMLGQPRMHDRNGGEVIYSAQARKQMADAAEAKLRAAEKALEDLLEQARRAGAQPGWLR